MKKVLLAFAASVLVSGCAFPVISTELTENSRFRADKGTGSNLPPRWQDTQGVKYMGREEFERMIQGQSLTSPPR